MKRIAVANVNINGAIIKAGKVFYASEVKGSGYGTPADPLYRIHFKRSQSYTVATVRLSVIDAFSVECDEPPSMVTGCTVTGRRNTRHGHDVPQHTFTSIGVHLCVLHGIRARRRLWVMDDNADGKVYVRTATHEFRAEHEIKIED